MYVALPRWTKRLRSIELRFFLLCFKSDAGVRALSFGCTDAIRGFHLLLGEVSPPAAGAQLSRIRVEEASSKKCRHHWVGGCQAAA